MTISSGVRTAYLPQAPDPAPGLRLFCFHHAGGVASSFADWPRRLRSRAAVVPVQLPGRERRIDEPRIRDLDRLLGELADELDGWLRPPFALYGHSMGALVAYTLAQRLHRAGRPMPERLLLGGYPAPHRPHALADAYRLDDAALARNLIELGDISPALRRYPAWLNAAVALVRDDLALCDSYRPGAGEPLPCPIDVFTGESDPLMRPLDAEEWDRHTTRDCTVHVIPGGHFFPWDSASLFLDRIDGVLAGAPRARPSSAAEPEPVG